MRLVLVTPATEPVFTLAEAKAQCRVEYGDEDLLIQHYIDAATALLDGPAGILGRCLITQTWRLEISTLPARLGLPFPDTEIDTAVFTDAEGGDVPYDTGWQGSRAMLFPRAGIGRPATISFRAGYGGPSDVPAAIRQAMLLLISHWYDHRSAIADPAGQPQAVDALLLPFRQVRP